MSSLMGHAAAGLAVYLARHRLQEQRSWPALPIYVGLAICADFDYLALWLFDGRVVPRLTHTVAFAVVAAGLARLGTAHRRRHDAGWMPWSALLLASGSHLWLDFWVGAHPLPLLWPLSRPDLTAPFGLLPSAGRLALGNIYLWRNLLIELGVLLPVLAMLVALARRTPRDTVARWALWVVPGWLAFLGGSLSLQR